MTISYYRKGNETVYLYSEDKDWYSVLDISKTPSGYFCSNRDGKPDDKYLIKSGLSNCQDAMILHFDGIRENHDWYTYDYEVGTYLGSPNDDRFKYDNVGGRYFMVYEPFHPRYRVYRYRGEIYIWCCDEHSIRHITKCEGVTKIEYEEFPATDDYHRSLETDWDFLAEFNTWYDCFYHYVVRFKTHEEMVVGENK